MNSFFHKLSVCLGVQCLLLATSCDYMYDDDLPPCDYHLRFVYDYNMKFADAFQKEVEHATLFIFDQSGVFLQKRQIEGEELKRNRIDLPLDPGTYQLVTWAGLCDDCNRCSEMHPGTSTLEDLCVRTQCDENRNNPNELCGLWHALDTLTIEKDQTGEKIVSLAKNTNKVRLILQDANGESLNVDDFDFSITADNGHMHHKNQLMDDDSITYLPYLRDNVEVGAVSSYDGLPSQKVALAELNTMRLMADENYRLLVTYKKQKAPVLNVNLNAYLALTKMLEHSDMSDQEFLDRQDQYALVLFLARQDCPECPDPDPDPDPDPTPDYIYMCIGVEVNDWVIRNNDTDL